MRIKLICVFFFFFKQKTAYEMRISDWSSDVCSTDLEQENLDDHDSAYDDDHVALLFTIRFFELLREVTNCPPDRRNMDIAITPKLGDFIDRGSRFLDEISHVCPQRNRRQIGRAHV